MSEHYKARLAAVDARDVEARIGLAVKRANAAVRMTEHEPFIIMTALADTLLLFLVTELGHVERPELRRQAFRLFRLRMDAMLKKLDEAEKLLGSANDAG